MREYSKIVRPSENNNNEQFSNRCEREHGQCCASRSLALTGLLNRYYATDAAELPESYDPFMNTLDKFTVPNSCDVFTDAFADYLNDLLPLCAPYYSMDMDSPLVKCAWAAETIADPNDANFDLAFLQILQCNNDVPPQCLTGDGAGVLDVFLSLLPGRTVEKLKEGKPYPILTVRTMVPVTGKPELYFYWKNDLIKDVLNPLYFRYNNFKTVDNKNTGVALAGFKCGIKRDLFAPAITHDIYYAVYAVVVIILLMWWYTGSLIVTTLAFLEIMSSLGLGYFFYFPVFRLPHFPFMNAVTIFLAVGIGADDVFVYVDSWRLSRDVVPRDAGGEEEEKGWRLWKRRKNAARTAKRLEYSLKHAGMSTFVTSFTTAAAFLANGMSHIISVKCFGTYAALVVLADYVLMITFLPAVCVVFDDAVCGRETAGEGGKLAKCFARVDGWKTMFFETVIPAVLLGPERDRASTTKGKKYVLAKGKEVLPPVMWCCGFFVVGMICTIFAFFDPGLSLPTSPTYQLFDITHPIEQWDMR